MEEHNEVYQAHPGMLKYQVQKGIAFKNVVGLFIFYNNRLEITRKKANVYSM